MEPTVKTVENRAFWELREVPEKRGEGFPKRRGERRWEGRLEERRRRISKSRHRKTVKKVGV
jgi:hypothetical protein